MYGWGEAEIEAQPDVEHHEDFTDAHLDHHVESSLALFRWCRTLEYWYVRLWNKRHLDEPILDKSSFLGRGLPPAFKSFPLKKQGAIIFLAVLILAVMKVLVVVLCYCLSE